MKIEYLMLLVAWITGGYVGWTLCYLRMSRLQFKAEHKAMIKETQGVINDARFALLEKPKDLKDN